MNKVIKIFEPIFCPHCKEQLLVGFQATMPNVISTPTLDDVARAKADVERRLDEIDFCDEKDKQEVIAYLRNEETIIDFSDVELMLKQIATEQITKKQQQNESTGYSPNKN